MLFKVVLVAVVVNAVLGKPWSIEKRPDGSYNWGYQNPDGALQGQESEIKPDGNTVIRGVAKWYDPEGKFHEVVYQADENGSNVNSNDIPRANWDVSRALRWNAAHPEEE